MGWATDADVEIGIGIDILYDRHLVMNEEAVNADKGVQTVYQLSAAGAVIPATMNASVYLDGLLIAVLDHRSETSDACFIHDPTENILSARVNCKTGRLIINWCNRVKAGQTKVVMTYEYLKG